MRKEFYEQLNKVLYVIIKRLLYEAYQYSQVEKGPENTEIFLKNFQLYFDPCIIMKLPLRLYAFHILL